MRPESDIGHGLDAFGGRGSIVPFAGLRTSAMGRDWRAGVRFGRGEAMEFGVDATRTESGAERFVHGTQLRFARTRRRRPGPAGGRAGVRNRVLRAAVDLTRFGGRTSGIVVFKPPAPGARLLLFRAPSRIPALALLP